MTRLLAFAAVLAAVFVGALILGDAVGPERSDDEPAAEEHATGHGGGEAAANPVPRGLAYRANGVELELDRTRFRPGRAADFAFRVVDHRGEPVRDFEIEHERRMHLIVVRRDMAGYQHLHPKQAPDGTWRVPLRLDAPGTYRMFADFKRDGTAITLGYDIEAAGDYAPRRLPAPSEVAHTPDGYEVSLESAGGEIDFEVARDGRAVTDIEPYLGARGHLVALRDGDLAYLHVHPDEERLAFGVEYPSAGRYRLFLQFKHAGSVHTAAFTQEMDDARDH